MAIQGKDRSDTASRIRYIALTSKEVWRRRGICGQIWKAIGGYRATQENTRVTLRRGSSVALTSKKEWP